MLNIILTVVLQTVIISSIGYGVWRYYFKPMINETIEGFTDMFLNIFEREPVKHAMSVLGKKSGQSRSQKAIVDEVAKGIIDSPKFTTMKMAAEALGIDIDSMIEKHGAMGTITAFREIGSMIGLDLNQFLTKGLSVSELQNTPAKNPYL